MGTGIAPIPIIAAAIAAAAAACAAAASAGDAGGGGGTIPTAVMAARFGTAALSARLRGRCLGASSFSIFLVCFGVASPLPASGAAFPVPGTRRALPVFQMPDSARTAFASGPASMCPFFRQCESPSCGECTARAQEPQARPLPLAPAPSNDKLSIRLAWQRRAALARSSVLRFCPSHQERFSRPVRAALTSPRSGAPHRWWGLWDVRATQYAMPLCDRAHASHRCAPRHQTGVAVRGGGLAHRRPQICAFGPGLRCRLNR